MKIFYVLGVKTSVQVPWCILEELDDEFNAKSSKSLARKQRTTEYLASNSKTDSTVSPVTPRSTPTVCDTPLGKRQPKPVRLFTLPYEGHADDIWFDNDSDSESTSDNDNDWPLPLRYNRDSTKRPDYVCATFNTKELAKNMAKTSVVNKTSLNGEYRNTCAILKAGGVDLNDVILSPNSIRRHRKTHIQETASSLRENFQCPEFLVVHYDSKIIKYKGGRTEDRMAVVFSSPGVLDSQFAGIPALPDGTAGSCTAAIQDVVVRWEVKPSVKVQVFDTPAVNTGHITGVCQQLSEWLECPTLQCACRHHTGELHVYHAYVACRGNKYLRSKSNTLHHKLLKEWPRLDPMIKDNPDQLLKWNRPADPNDWRCQQADFVIEWGRDISINGSFRRGDHKDALDLDLRYLGATPLNRWKDGTIHEVKSVKRPIVSNQSRFLATAINELVIAMVQFNGWLELDEEAREETEATAEFLALVWIPYFLRVRLAAAAARIDRQFLEDLQNWKACYLFDSIQACMADAAIESLTRHSWYFAPEVIPFCLWDDDLPASERQAVARKMMTCPPPVTYVPEKPKLLHSLPLFPNKLRFQDLVNPRSHLIFHLFRLGSGWLSRPVRTWKTDPEYLKFGQFLHHLKVVNDIAERHIKDMGEYKDMVIDGLHMEDILQVVTDYRFVFRDVRKDAMNRVNYV